MHDIQLNKPNYEMNAYPFTLTPPSSSEDSPQNFSMHSPNYLYTTTMQHHMATPYVISAGDAQYDVPMPGIYSQDHKPPYLQIIEQPIDKFRFRYKSEMAGTHGSLTGINSDKTRKQTYPTVKLHNYYGPEVIVRCSLYQNGSSDERQPHAHRLIMKHGQEERDDPHDMLITKENKYEASFHSMGIIHTAKKHIVGELKRKKTLLKREEVARLDGVRRNLTIKEEVEIGATADEECKSINLNIVCLRFDAFRKENDIFYPICMPIYSHAINNLKSALTGELKIVRMDHSSSPAKGNREIFMLVEKVTKKNIKIRFFELDDDETEIWAEYGKFNDLDVHHQYAIVFRTPPYKDLCIEEHRKVFIELERPSDGSKSEPREFTYVPNQNYKTGMKRPRPSMYSSSEYSSASFNSGDLPTTLESFNNAVEVTSADLQAALGNIDSDEFKKLFIENWDEFKGITATPSLCTDSGKKVMTKKPVPEPDDTDKRIVKRVHEEFSDFLRSRPKSEQISRMLENLFTKHVNDAKENALHICAAEGNVKFLRLFLDMISSNKQYKLLNLKNADGETAIHLALQQTNPEVLVLMLKYPFDLSIKDTNGNTSLHVAVMKNQTHAVIDTILRSPYALGLFVNMENNDNLTALHMAIKMNKLKYVELLYKHGANVNLIDKKTGRNSLHIAITEQATDIVKLLLEKTNIEILKEDFGGFTPLKMAKHLMQDKEPQRIQIYNLIEALLKDRGLLTECIIKEEIESEEEMELEIVECKIEQLAIDELESMYKNVNELTPECLDRISKIVEDSGSLQILANKLGLTHLLYTNMLVSAKSKSKELLVVALKLKDLLTIRNCLNSMGEVEAVSIMDKMVMPIKMET